MLYPWWEQCRRRCYKHCSNRIVTGSYSGGCCEGRKYGDKAEGCRTGAARAIRSLMYRAEREVGGKCEACRPARLSQCAAARRLRDLLVDVEYELQVLSGASAMTMLQRLRAHQAVVVQREEDGDFSMFLHERRARELEQGLQEEDGREGGENAERETLPRLSVLSQYPAPRVLHLFPYELARRYRCVPVGAERSILTLATCQHLEADVIAYFQEVTRRNIFLVRCEEHMVEDVLLYWQRILPIHPYAASM